MSDDGWLDRSLRSAREEVATWPDWKRAAYRVLPDEQIEPKRGPMSTLDGKRFAEDVVRCKVIAAHPETIEMLRTDPRWADILAHVRIVEDAWLGRGNVYTGDGFTPAGASADRPIVHVRRIHIALASRGESRGSAPPSAADASKTSRILEREKGFEPSTSTLARVQSLAHGAADAEKQGDSARTGGSTDDDG